MSIRAKLLLCFGAVAALFAVVAASSVRILNLKENQGAKLNFAGMLRQVTQRIATGVLLVDQGNTAEIRERWRRNLDLYEVELDRNLRAIRFGGEFRTSEGDILEIPPAEAADVLELLDPAIEQWERLQAEIGRFRDRPERATPGPDAAEADRLTAAIENFVGRINAVAHRYYLNLQRQHAQLLAVQKVALAGLLLVLVVSLWVISTGVLRPLRHVVDFSRDISAGKARAAIPGQRQDELGQLLASLNQILDEMRVSRDRTAEALAAQKALVDNVVDGIVTINRDGIIQSFNKAAEKLFGHRAEEVIGKNVKLLIPEPDRSMHDTYIRRYLESGVRKVIGIGRETVGLRKDGALFTIELSVGEFSTASGPMFTALIRDVTERKRAEEDLRAAKEEAERANAAKSDFLASMSHELRTPLNAVIGFANILRRRESRVDGEEERSYVERIRENGLHLLRLINEVLDLSKIDAGRMETEISEVKLPELVRDTVAQLESQAQEKGLVLTAELPEAAPPLAADKQKLRQVLINLVGNAIKFTHRGGVVLRLEMEGESASHLDVIDSGVGIPKDKLDKIFEAFVQAEDGTRRKYGGTGLGLTISRSYLRLMGFDLVATSEVGGGSTFRILFRPEGKVPGARA